MKKLSLLLLAVCGFSIVSCETFWGIKTVDSLILTYSKITNEATVRLLTDTHNDSLYLRVVFDSERIADAQSMHGGTSYGDLYDSLRHAYNDVGYPIPYKTAPTGDPSMLYPAVYIDEVHDIDIVSDMAWGQYAPGTSLNSLFTVEIASHFPYIESRYAPEYCIVDDSTAPGDYRDFYNNVYTDRYLYRIPLDEAKPEYFKMLDVSLGIRLSVPLSEVPENPKLTVIVTMQDGRELKGYISSIDGTKSGARNVLLNN